MGKAVFDVCSAAGRFPFPLLVEPCRARCCWNVPPTRPGESQRKILQDGGFAGTRLAEDHYAVRVANRLRHVLRLRFLGSATGDGEGHVEPVELVRIAQYT